MPLFRIFIFVFVFSLGPRSWLTWRKELDLAADLLYFGLTTCAGCWSHGFFSDLLYQCLPDIIHDNLGDCREIKYPRLDLTLGSVNGLNNLVVCNCLLIVSKSKWNCNKLSSVWIATHAVEIILILKYDIP